MYHCDSQTPELVNNDIRFSVSSFEVAPGHHVSSGVLIRRIMERARVVVLWTLVHDEAELETFRFLDTSSGWCVCRHAPKGAPLFFFCFLMDLVGVG